MTHAEHVKLGVVLAELWPGKFDQPDFEVWFQEFDRYPLAEVVRALHTWRNRKPFPPKTEEIKAVLKAHDVDPVPADRPANIERRSFIARMMIADKPDLAHLSEPEIIVKYYRGIFLRYVDRRLAPAKILGGEVKQAELDGIEAQRRSVTNQCKCEFVNSGMELELAERFAPCPTLDQPEYQQLLTELQNHVAGVCQVAQ